MAAVTLTIGGGTLTHLPFLLRSTCSSTPGNVRRVNITSSRDLEYTVFAGLTDALKVGWLVDASAIADEAAASTMDYVDVPATGSFTFTLGPNRRIGLPAVSQFYVWSAAADAAYVIGVTEEDE